MEEKYFLETERLLHRRIRPDDLEMLIGMRSDSEVNKYLGGTRLQNPEALAKRMEFYLATWEKYGFGFSIIIWKETGEEIGWSGLQPLEDTGDIEVGYGMIKKFWGQGIGYETAMGWLKYGFETVGLERLVAIAIPGNTGSWRIMEKCGMKYEKTEEHYGEKCVFLRNFARRIFGRSGKRDLTRNLNLFQNKIIKLCESTDGKKLIFSFLATSRSRRGMSSEETKKGRFNVL